MNDQQWQQLNARLAGIELPPEPDWWPLIWTAAAVAVALLILAVLVVRQRSKSKATQSRAAEASQRLRQLQQTWQAGELESRRAAYQLATLLRLGLGLKQLNDTPPPQLADQQPQWQSTLATLAQLRYQPGKTELSEQTFDQIRAWLQC